MTHEFDNRAQVFRTCLLPRRAGLLLYRQVLGIHDVSLLAVAEEVDDESRAKAQREVTGRDGTLLVGSTGTDDRAVVGLDGKELAAVGIERGEAVEPERRLAHRAVEGERALPDVRLTRMREVGLRQRENAVALLHQSGLTADASTRHRAGVGGVVDLHILSRALAGSRSLYPRRHVDGQDVGLGTVVDAHAAVARLADEHMLAVEAGTDASAVFHFLAVVVGEWRRSYGDALQLTEEVTGVWRLVVAAHLPHHRVSILVVVPKRVVAPLRSGGR